MNGLSRFAVAAVLVASVGSVAQAQSRSVQQSDGSYQALATGRSVVDNERTPQWRDATVAPSYSHTVMGLSVPR